jgi:hypothetical protein
MFGLAPHLSHPCKAETGAWQQEHITISLMQKGLGSALLTPLFTMHFVTTLA